LRPEFDYEPTKGINVRGISNALLKTEGTVTLKLLTPTHYTLHTHFMSWETVLIVNTTEFWVTRGPLSLIVILQL